MARTNLKVFRVKQHMSQEEMAAKIDFQRSTYSAIESGKRNGRRAFWIELQKAFNIPEADMWELMKNDED